MIVTCWILLVVFGIVSAKMLWTEVVGNGLTRLGWTVMFLSTTVVAVSAGVIFGNLHISGLGI